jgi:alpha-1,3/alpha-1,6-mannosyltransferase
LIYTPRNEHLGIVPLEAMLAGIPVLAADEGGPRETVVEGQTGWLRNVAKIDDWAEVMNNVLDGTVSDAALQKMGQDGRERVKTLFSKEKMASRLDEELELLNKTSRPPVVKVSLVITTLGIVSGLVAAWYIS